MDRYLASSTCTALMRVGTRMASGFDKHFAPLGITQAQFRTLLAIRQLGGAAGIAPSALADHLLIERATVSVLTSRMVDKGWIARKPGANRRTFQLVLTAPGKRLLAKLIPRAVALADETLSHIPRSHLRQMLAGMTLVEARLRSKAGEE